MRTRKSLTAARVPAGKKCCKFGVMRLISRLCKCLLIFAICASTAWAEGALEQKVRLVVVDFRKPDLHMTFVNSMKASLALRKATRELAMVKFVSCPMGARDVAVCATDALAENPTLVYATTTDIAKEIRRISPLLPIVFSGTRDPREIDLVSRLDRPGNNLTGFTSYADTFVKRLEILKDAVLNLRRVAVVKGAVQLADTDVASMHVAAKRLGLKLSFVNIGMEESDATLRQILCKKNIDALDVHTSAELRNNPRMITRVLKSCGKPGIFMHEDFVKLGGFMSYGANGFRYEEKAVEYIARAINTNNIGDIPIEFSTHFTFAVNIRTAEHLVKKINPSILKRADVIFTEDQ